MVAVSVVVAAVDDVEQVKELVRSLDRQTLPGDDFEVVLSGVDGQTGADQLDALAAHRPNLKVLHTPGPTPDLLAALEGDFVLAVGQDERLFPGALARLHDFAGRHEVDVVVARVVDPAGPAPVPLWTDADATEDAALLGLVGGTSDAVAGQLLVRRDAATLTDQGRLATSAVRVGVLGRHAVSRRRPAAEDATPEASPEPELTVDGLEWRDDALHLALRVPDDETAPGDRRAALQLSHRDTGETFLVPAEIAPASPGEGAGPEVPPRGSDLLVTADLAPARTPAAGEPLAEGRWDVGLVLAADGRTAPVRPVPWSPARPAVIGALAVVPAPGGRQSTLTLDVGPTEQPLLSDLDPSGSTITESVTGMELLLDLPQLHTFETDGIEGAIALAKMRLPARIRVRDGRAQLVALVTGLAGQLPFSAQFGPGPLRPTGLSLQISGIGSMALVATPPPPAPAPKPAPVAAPTPPPTAKPTVRKKKRRRKKEPPRTGALADLRRAVPRPLEPVAKRLAAVPVARRLYRRLTR